MAEPNRCDLLIRNALVATFDARDVFVPDGAIAITGNRIVAVGTTEDVASRFAAGTTIDGIGFYAIPGLINSHNHSPLGVTRGMIEDSTVAPMYTRSVPQGHLLQADESLALARLGHYELLCAGCTTVIDFYRQPATLALAAEEIGTRAVITGRIHDINLELLTEKKMVHSEAVGEETLGETLELFTKWDGAAEGRITCEFGVHGTDTCTPALLRRVADLAPRHGGRVHLHLAHARGEVAYVKERDGMTPTELLAEVGLLDQPLVAAHCVFVDEADRRRLGDARVTVAHAPHQNAPAGNSAPIRELQAAGAQITLCTDARSGNLFEAMRLAIASWRLRNGGYEPTARQVLGWTIDGAAAALGWNDLGRIETGCRADIVLLDRRDPNLAPIIDGYGILAYGASGFNVDTVIVDGKVRLAGRRPVGFDGDAVVREAQAVAERLWLRCGQRHSIAVPVEQVQ
jgi:5-methylthioadenosine/S-adenosylhomocysteine deaminase